MGRKQQLFVIALRCLTIFSVALYMENPVVLESYFKNDLQMLPLQSQVRGEIRSTDNLFCRHLQTEPHREKAVQSNLY